MALYIATYIAMCKAMYIVMYTAMYIAPYGPECLFHGLMGRVGVVLETSAFIVWIPNSDNVLGFTTSGIYFTGSWVVQDSCGKPGFVFDGLQIVVSSFVS